MMARPIRPPRALPPAADSNAPQAYRDAATVREVA
jgi:hypothetical protein